jgi:predicted nuclease of restriction endonuclease-like (RecB) superfamily
MRKRLRIWGAQVIFLSLGAEAQERDLERGLLEHIQSFLLELGVVSPSWAANIGST